MGMGICHSKMADFETNSVEETKNPFQISKREKNKQIRSSLPLALT